MTVVKVIGWLAVVLLGACAAGFVLDRDPVLDRGARAFGCAASVGFMGLLVWVLV